MSVMGDRIKEVIRNTFKGKPIFKFNFYDLKKLSLIMKEDQTVKSYDINFIREIITIIPNEVIGKEPVVIEFARFIGWGRNIYDNGQEQIN